MARAKLSKGKVLLKTPIGEREKAKQLLGGKWNSKELYWEFPLSAVTDVARVFGTGILAEDPKLKDLYLSMVANEAYAGGIKSRAIAVTPTGMLMEHQQRCLSLSQKFDKYAFFMDTGTGKTVAALSVMADNADTKWLIIVPKTIIRTAWLADAAQFYPHLRILPLSKNFTGADYWELAARWKCAPRRRVTVANLKHGLAQIADAVIINPESFKAEFSYLCSLPLTGLVLDESAVIKNYASDTTKKILKFGDRVEKCYILSGKPAPNSPLEYYPQMELVEKGLLGATFYQYRSYYFQPEGYMGHQWKPRMGAVEEIGARISRRAYFISKEDCLDLPEKTYIRHEIEMPAQAMKYYKEMERHRLMELPDRIVVTPNILAAMMKLRQITSGFVLTEDEEDSPILHTEKLDTLMEILEEIGDKPVIVWCNFKKEIRMIEEALLKQGKTVVTAYSGTKSVDDSIEAFKDGTAQYIIAHPATLKYGVTFTHCTYAVYYSLSYSFENYYQSHDRIYRKGQTKPCTFLFLLCPGTIDMMIYEVLQNKGDIAKAMEDYVKGVK